MIIAQLSIAPIGKATSLHTYVQKVIDILQSEKISFETNAMGTIIETDSLEKLFTVVEKAHKAVLSAGAQRVITELKIDDRHDKTATMKTKLAQLNFSQKT
ncbi:MAG: MTH1187 family thiamine-binding protein [Candidatus Thermoplasmatota archaeon]|nr:MTH1187 family thiamine-binding protein [Candidatus Thermoplasmatota archaeon]MBU1940586.1 MTH1187 family thiamine-binding protein [Candidatus Thermoplasmatota archaeon]